MHLDFTPEQEVQLSQLASRQGKNAEELAKDAVLSVLQDNVRFLAAVQEGLEQANRGEFIEHAEVLNRVDRLLKQ